MGNMANCFRLFGKTFKIKKLGITGLTRGEDEIVARVCGVKCGVVRAQLQMSPRIFAIHDHEHEDEHAGRTT
jgi:hypothetical protein